MVQWVGVYVKETSIMFESAKNRLGQQVGNYRLTGWLGQGGFADVYQVSCGYLTMGSTMEIPTSS